MPQYRTSQSSQTTAMKNISLFFLGLWAWMRDLVVFSNTLVFIWGLKASFVVMYYGVVYFFPDYLSDYFGGKLRKAAILGNLLDGLSSIFNVATHISQSYIGDFNVIIFCTAASVIGVMLLIIWDVNYVSFSAFGMIYVSLILVALVEAGKSTLLDFLELQLKQNANQSPGRTSNGENEAYIWRSSAWITGFVFTLFWLSQLHRADLFTCTALIMGIAYLWFYCGCFCYSFKKPIKSPLFQIYRVFKAAWLNSRVEYPASEDEDKYYWKNITQRDLYLHRERDTQIRLKPYVPSMLRFLDKAAIIRDTSSDVNSLQRQETNGELCPVEQVREVKLLTSLIHFGLTLLPYSLVRGAESTFFILQIENMKHASYITAISFLRNGTGVVVDQLYWKLNLTQQRITIVRIGLGMICAVLCCIVACFVEIYRKKLVRKEHILYYPDKEMSISITIMIPQFLLVGFAKALADCGYQVLFRNHVPESMGDSVKQLRNFVFFLGSLLNMLLIYLITPWFKDSLNTSRLHEYYLMLAILNFGALLLYGYFSWNYIYNGGYTEDEILGSYQNGQEEVGTGAQSSMIQGDSDHATAGTSIMVAAEERPLRQVVQQNPGTGLVSRSSSLVRREQQ